MIGVDYASVDRMAPPDWAKAYANGIRFAIIRGAYGTRVDPTLERDFAAAQDAGLVAGCYLFLRTGPGAPAPESQAQTLLAVWGKAARVGAILPPAIDIEFPGGGRAELGITPADARAWCDRAWRTLSTGLVGVAPLIYTSGRVWREDLGDAQYAPSGWLESPLWLARYPYKSNTAARLPPPDTLAAPPIPRPWDDKANGDGNWWIHQYQGDALGVPGFNRTTDLNRFHVLRAGAQGARVRWVQRRLGEVPRTLTWGVFDALTTKRLQKFQRANGLADDGVVGPRTFAALCWSNPT